MKSLKNVAILALGLSLSVSALAQQKNSPVINFWGSYNINGLHQDPSKPQTGRSYLTTQVQPIAGGVRLTIDLWHGKINEPVSLYLEAALNDGTGKLEPIPFFALSEKKVETKDATGKVISTKLVGIADNPTDYHSRRVFDLSYADINTHLKAVLPAAAAKNIEVGPGSPLLVLGQWTDYGHTWGGLGRGGIIYMPEVPGVASAVTSGTVRTPTDLDIGYPITSGMAMSYNHVDDKGVSHGLKENGQIKSRLESEGKYQVFLEQTSNVTSRLFALSNDANEAAKILGPDWTIQAEMKYMKKDAKTGAYIKDANGLPVPDPMVDTYYDSQDNLGAKNDISIRYRWTEGNGEGAWNLKPGFSKPSPEGVVRRIEYGVETTDDKPETVKKFADSMDPLNPFKSIREMIPGAVPSNFLHPAVKIVDTRYKFKLKHKNGLIIEVSVDNVHAQSLRIPGHEAKYTQMEMDVDHPAAQSSNVAQGISGFGNTLSATINPQMQTFLNGLTESAFLDGRPVIHTVADLDPNSQLSQKIAPDLQMADQITKELRNDVVGGSWIQGPQKYSLAAVLVGHVNKEEASGSVKATARRINELKAKGETRRLFEAVRGAMMCKDVMNGLH